MKKIVGLFAVLLLSISLYIWFGIYNIAATDKHWGITNAILEILRDRSIETRLEGIDIPDLSDPMRIASGAANYDAMCAQCHLSPGVLSSEMYTGLYPQPPIFYQEKHGSHDVRANFWVIKNGIKLTGMPAWGSSHSDKEIWDMVAFINTINDISAEQYAIITSENKGLLGHGQGGHGH